MVKIVKPLRSGQVTIPIDFRQRLGITPDSLLQVSLLDGEIRIKPVKATAIAAGSSWFRELYDYFTSVRKDASRRYNEKEINITIDQAVQAVRKRHD